MRTSLYVGLAIAFIVIGYHNEIVEDTNLRVSVNYVSANESLDTPVATTTLVAAPESVWSAPLQVAESPEEATEPEIAAPTVTAVAAKTIAPKKAAPPAPENPARLLIPSISLDSNIVPVGVNAKGEMDVPSGETNNVGWYKGGPKPGQMGSAVLDAHVFAAFEDLRYLKVGEDVIVETANGTRLRFVVEESTVYKLGDITPSMLFGRGDARWLNLITCAGSPVGDTYSHRLIVYTKFVEVL